MDLMTLASNKKTPLRRITRPSPINSLDDDVLSIIFSLLDDCFDLMNCSLVCKTWSSVITKSKLLAAQMGLVKGLCLEEMITETHRLALQQSSRINVDQWKAHAASFYECRKKNALLLTSGRDKVMRLWSVNSHKSVYTFEREYKIPLEYGHLAADFDFDKSKIVGLVKKNSRQFICVWSRNGMTGVINPLMDDDRYPFTMGTCMRYCDSNVVVGCGDGNAHVFDMYSAQCSQIRRMKSTMNSHDGPLTCLELSNDDSRLLILAGSHSNITMSSGLVGDPVARLSTNYGASYVRTLCYNPCGDDHWMVFGGSGGGYVHCWDLRTRKSLWNTEVSRYAVFSVQQLRNAAASDLFVGGADGVLRVLDHDTGEVISRIVLDTGYCALPSSTSSTTRAPVQRLRGKGCQRMPLLMTTFVHLLLPAWRLG